MRGLFLLRMEACRARRKPGKMVGATGVRCRRIGRSRAGGEAPCIRRRRQRRARASDARGGYPGGQRGADAVRPVLAFRSPRLGVQELQTNRPTGNENAAEDTRCSPHSQLQPLAAAIPASASHPSPQPRCPLTTQPRDQIGEQSLTYKKRGNYVGGFDLCRRATWRKGR
jgi:hypothetical protein